MSTGKVMSGNSFLSLFKRDVRTLTELASELEMTRFGVMKHLRLLEDAGLVVTRRSGREKLHFLNAVPIRLIHDRWIDKYTASRVRARESESQSGGKEMTTTAQPTKTIQMYRVRIKATPQAIWDAITKPEWTQKDGYAPLVEYDLRTGGKFRAYPNEGMKQFPSVPDVLLDGEVVEASPPRKLVQTWRMLMDPGLAAEGFTRLTYEIQKARGGVTKLTVTHDVTGAPKLAVLVAGELEGEARAVAGTRSSAVSRRCWRPERSCRSKRSGERMKGRATRSDHSCLSASIGSSPAAR